MGCPGRRMPDDNDIRSHGLQVFSSIDQSFTLYDAARRDRNIDDICTESFSSDFKRCSSSGRGFKEKVNNCLSPQGGNFLDGPGRDLAERMSSPQDEFDLLRRDSLNSE